MYVRCAEKMPPGKNASQKICLLGNILSSIITLQVHITTSEASSFFDLSLIVANACPKFTVFYPFCLAVQRYVSFSSKVLLVLLTLLAGCSSLVSIMTGVVFFL